MAPQPLSYFPTYLLPSIPFRRRSSPATTNSSGANAASPSTPSATRNDAVITTRSSSSASPESSCSPATPPSPTFLSGHASILRCSRCLTHLCHTSQIISRGFTGRHGRAYLVAPASSPGSSPLSPNFPVMPSSAGAMQALPNTNVGKPVPRQLVTGAHTVSDLACRGCDQTIGWKYVAAEEEGQRYKVGKFILETKRVSKGVCWEDEDANADVDLKGAVGLGLQAVDMKDGSSEDEEPIEFDSQDEDECEDLFMGIWSEALAKRRRRIKMWKDGQANN